MEKAAKRELLDIEFECGDLDRTLTIRDYLRELLKTLWKQGESFSGKRPFGNSGWEFDVYAALIMAEAIPGSFDADGCIDECDTNQADKLIMSLIDQL